MAKGDAVEGHDSAQPRIVATTSRWNCARYVAGSVTSADVVRNVFGLASGTGAIEIDVDDTAASHLAITSRTFNTSPTGVFGQDIPAVSAADAAGLGDLSVLAGPGFASDFRFNFGAYAVTDATISWQLVRSNGTVAAAKDVDYKAGTQFQYNNGIVTLLGSTAADGDVIYATVTKGKAIVYGSSINNLSGDPTFVPGIRIRGDSHIAASWAETPSVRGFTTSS